LARAILVNSKIFVLDEATANVDLETDNLIQDKLRANFKNCTLLVIAHRLPTVIDSDRILVMEGGKGVEFDHPFKLLALLEDDLTITKESLLAEMVKSTGAEQAQQLFEIAKNHYFKSKAELIN